MTATLGITGAVTSWTNYSGLLSGILAEHSATLNVNAPELDSTAFGGNADPDAFMDTFLAGLYDISGTIECYFPNTPALGAGGLVTYASGYATNIREWDMTIEFTELDDTAFNASGVLARTFQAGKARWGGTYSGFIDGTTAVANVTAVGTAAAAATFKLTEDGATDNTLAGSILATQLGAVLRVGDLNRVTYSYRGSGNLTATGAALRTASNGVFDASDGLLQRAVVSGSTLTLTAATGRTYAVAAFPRRITFRVAVDQILSAVVDFRGSGVLTVG